MRCCWDRCGTAGTAKIFAVCFFAACIIWKENGRCCWDRCGTAGTAKIFAVCFFAACIIWKENGRCCWDRCGAAGTARDFADFSFAACCPSDLLLQLGNLRDDRLGAYFFGQANCRIPVPQLASPVRAKVQGLGCHVESLVRFTASGRTQQHRATMQVGHEEVSIGRGRVARHCGGVLTGRAVPNQVDGCAHEEATRNLSQNGYGWAGGVSRNE